MADVLNRTTKQYLQSVNTPDYDVGDWIINPDLSSVAGVPNKYWKIVGDAVSEMTQLEKDSVDAAEAVAVLLVASDVSQVEDEFETTSGEYVSVLELNPINAFSEGDYIVYWESSLRRQSNRGLINLRVLVDGVDVFELTDLDPRQWMHQNGRVSVAWLQGTHTVALQVSSTATGKSVFVKNAKIAVERANNG